jgi:hypothetical protein
VGRTLPYECPVHPDVTIDWGDFGPCQGHCDEVHPDNLDECLDAPGCFKCDREAHIQSSNPFDLFETTNAAKWATDFVERFAGRTVQEGDVDFGVMVGWFANAIETGRRAALNGGDDR